MNAIDSTAPIYCIRITLLSLVKAIAIKIIQVFGRLAETS